MKKVTIEVKLPVTFFREDKYYIAHTPALDLSTSGKSFKEVRKRFVEAVEIFFEELAEKGTLDDVLQNLGWKKVRRFWQPPVFISHELESIKISPTIH